MCAVKLNLTIQSKDSDTVNMIKLFSCYWLLGTMQMCGKCHIFLTFYSHRIFKLSSKGPVSVHLQELVCKAGDEALSYFGHFEQKQMK